MKKILFSILASLLLISPKIYAATATPTATMQTATNSAEEEKNKKIDELKERLATKVAELRHVERRAMYGTIKSKSTSSVIVETKTKDAKIDLSDNVAIAQIIKGKRTLLTQDDLSTGDTVTLFGDYDSILDLLKADKIFIQGILPVRVNGTVTAIDRSDYSLTLAAPDGQTYTIDIETTTKITRWDKLQKFTKSGFSKMTQGETLHIIGTPVPKKDNRISAIRILNLGNPVGEPVASPSATLTPDQEAKASSSAPKK